MHKNNNRFKKFKTKIIKKGKRKKKEEERKNKKGKLHKTAKAQCKGRGL